MQEGMVCEVMGLARSRQAWLAGKGLEGEVDWGHQVFKGP